MKILILLFSIAIVTVAALHAQPAEKLQNFSLTGKLTGRDTGIIWLSYINADNKEVKDTTWLKNGEFTFKGYIAGPARAIILGSIKSRSMDDPNYTELFIEPTNMQTTLVENDFKNFTLTGSQVQDDMNLLKKQEAGITGRDSLSKVALLFIKQHPSSCLSAYLLQDNFDARQLPLDLAGQLFNAFTSQVKNSTFGHALYNSMVQRKASSPGNMASVFSKTGIDGKTITLSNYRNKNYVLLDFWASWCVLCRADNPHLRRIYQQFNKKGLEIISISWDSDTESWLKAIDKDSTGSWRHIQANIFKTPPVDNGLRTTYAIAAIPSLILIDKKGVVLGRYRGSDEEGTLDELDKKLAAIFDNK